MHVPSTWLLAALISAIVLTLPPNIARGATLQAFPPGSIGAGSTLAYSADTLVPEQNNLTITAAGGPSGGFFTVKDTGATAITLFGSATAAGCTSVNATTAKCPLGTISIIFVSLGSLDDEASVSTGTPTKFVGGSGNDTLTGGSAADWFVADAGSDTYAGLGGADVVDYSARAAVQTIDEDGVADDGDASDESAGVRDNVMPDIETILGGGAADSITGGGADNVISGGDGNDTLEGGGGSDSILGGLADDTLSGDAGDDSLDGGAGDDSLDGGAGADGLAGGAGDDTTSYAARNVDLDLSADDSPDDGAVGEHDNVGSDVETITGGSGDDRLTGADLVANTLNGGPGNDTLIGRSGPDELIGGDGTDTVDYSDATDVVNANLAGDAGDGIAGENDTVHADVENLLGGSGDDLLTGDSAANLLDGGPGDDLLDGAAGPDALLGGPGTDTVSYATRSAAVAVDAGPAGGDGESGENDNVDAETVLGGSGSDLLVAPQGGGALLGGAGNDLLVGGPGFDLLSGGTGNDTLAGEGSRDVLSGDAGDDVLGAGPGNDTLLAGEGNDLLEGGQGADDLAGGPGADTGDYSARTGALSLSADGSPNDGEPGEGDNLRTDVERLVAGSGDDFVDVRNLLANSVVCGGGTDTVETDLGSTDRTAPDCESVVRAKRVGAISISARRVKASRKGRVAVTLSCSSYADCDGRLRLKARKRRVRVHRRKLRVPRSLASGRYQLKAGQRKKIRMKLRRPARRVLKRAHKLSARATATPTDSLSRPAVSRNLTIRAAGRKKR